MARGVERARFAQHRPGEWSDQKLDAFLTLLEMGDVLEAFDRVRKLLGETSQAGNDLRQALEDHTRELGTRFLETP